MTKPGFSQSTTGGADAARVARAVEVAQRVGRGEAVAPQAVAQSRDALLDALWSGRAAAAPAQQGLVALCQAAGSAEERGELLGELVAAGEHARPILAQLVGSAAGAAVGGLLSADEWRSLTEGLSLPAAERLGRIGAMLSREAPAAASSTPADSARAPQEQALEPRATPAADIRADGRATTEGGPDGRGAGTQASEAAAEGARLDAVVAQGPAAIPGLVRQLGGGEGEREFAALALVRLGRNPQAGRAVYSEMRRLEGDPALRPTAEFVRGQLDRGGGDAVARHRARNAGIGSGMLMRALAACDAPCLLRAATGRETIAIPLALGHLVALRGRQRGANRS